MGAGRENSVSSSRQRAGIEGLWSSHKEGETSPRGFAWRSQAAGAIGGETTFPLLWSDPWVTQVATGW